MRRGVPAGPALLVALAACGSAGRANGAARAPAAVQAVSNRPARSSSASVPPAVTSVAPPYSPGPCTYPDDIASLDDVRAASDIVVVGRISPAPFRRVPFGSYYTVDVSQVVESRLDGPPPATLPLLVDGPVVPGLFPDHEDVVFLFADRAAHTVDPELGIPSYQLTDGLLGLFPVRAGRVYRQCTGAGTVPVHATGARQGESLAAFLARLRSRPRPPQDPREHDPAAFSPPPG